MEPWTEQLAKLTSRLSSKKNTQEGRSILQNADKLTLSGGLLYYRYKPEYGIEEVKCFIVTRAHRRTAIDGCHHDAGHQGKKRTESLISDRFWWPGVYEDVNRAVQNCRWCELYGGREEKAPMVQMMVHPNESPKVKHVIVDHFTRYTRAYVIATKTLFKEFISIFGAPKRILTDQGKAFTSEVEEQLCSQFRISQSTTTAYHPQGNGQVKPAHQTLGRMIGKLEDEYKGQWPRHLSKLTHAYNSTRSAITGYLPHQQCSSDSYGCQSTLCSLHMRSWAP